MSKSNPKQRPTLDKLERKLKEMALEVQRNVAERQMLLDLAIHRIRKVSLDCEGQQIEQDISACRIYLFDKVAEAFNSLTQKEPEISKKDPALLNAMDEKNEDIKKVINGWRSKKFIPFHRLNFNEHLETFKAINQEINQDFYLRRSNFAKL